MDKVESIKVNSLTDLNRVIKELLPVAIENKTRMVNMENIEDPQGNLYKNFPVKFTDDGQPMVRKLLVDGFELLKRQQEFSSASGIFAGDDIDGFGGFYPAVKPVDDIGTGWVTSFVSKRDGFLVPKTRGLEAKPRLLITSYIDLRFRVFTSSLAL